MGIRQPDAGSDSGVFCYIRGRVDAVGLSEQILKASALEIILLNSKDFVNSAWLELSKYLLDKASGR